MKSTVNLTPLCTGASTMAEYSSTVLTVTAIKTSAEKDAAKKLTLAYTLI